MDKNLGFVEMSEDEMMSVDGGIAGWIIVGGCILIFGLGVYNGYKDTRK